MNPDTPKKPQHYYHNWLGISPQQQPPSAYALLGLADGETDREVIHDGYSRQRAHVRRFLKSDDKAAAQALIKEIELALEELLAILDPQPAQPQDDPLDPCHRWLGVPPEQQPANLYQLLGLETFENHTTAIKNAADRQIAHVRTYQLGEYSEQSQDLLNQLANARKILLDDTARIAYDSSLKQNIQQQSTGLFSDLKIKTQPQKRKKRGSRYLLWGSVYTCAMLLIGIMGILWLNRNHNDGPILDSANGNQHPEQLAPLPELLPFETQTIFAGETVTLQPQLSGTTTPIELIYSLSTGSTALATIDSETGKTLFRTTRSTPAGKYFGTIGVARISTPSTRRDSDFTILVKPAWPKLTLKTDPPINHYQTDPSLQSPVLRLSPDEDSILHVSATKVLDQNIADVNKRWEFEGQSGRVVTAAYNSEGRNQVTVSPNGTTVDGKVTTADYSGGRNLIAASPNGITVWELNSGNIIQSHSMPMGKVKQLTVNHSGKKIGVRTKTKVVIINIDTGASIELEHHEQDVSQILFMHDNSTIIFSLRNEIIFRSIDPWLELKRLNSHSDEIRSLALSHDGKQLASCSRDNTMVLWNVKTQQKLGVFKEDEQNESFLNLVTFSPDGTKLATCSSDQTIALWDIKSKTKTNTLEKLEHPVTSISFNKNGKCITASSVAGTIDLFSTNSGKHLSTYYSFSASEDWIATTPKGLFDGTPGGCSKIFYQLEGGDTTVPADRLSQDMYYPSLLTRILKAEDPDQFLITALQQTLARPTRDGQ